MSAVKFTPVAEIPKMIQKVKNGFKRNLTRPIQKRKELLHTFVRMMNENEDAIVEALNKDLRKPKFESCAFEIQMIKSEIWEMLDNIDSWTKGKQAEKEGLMLIEDCQIERDPLGTVLIIGAWNFPFQVTMLPMVGAIAGGNTVVLKPSELSAYSAQLMADLCKKYFSDDVVTVINGAIKETSALLEEQFDHIMYTGSGRVGKIIMGAAAKHLTPVTLELGGKSPTIVDDTADLTVVAQRILWGKTANCGQICVAPDYVMVKKGIKAKLIEELKKAKNKFYGENAKDSISYGRIISEGHYQRLKGLLKQGTIAFGGETDDASRFIAPTVIEAPKKDSDLMNEEIFGPILPMIEFDTVDEVVDYVNNRDKPLALYIFSTNTKFTETIISNTSSGGVVTNDVMMHATVPGLPFGGVGGSGMGAYHGKHSFDCFTHKKAVMRRKLILEFSNDLRYPPYSDRNLKIMTTLLGKNGPAKWYLKYVALAAVGAILYFNFNFNLQFLKKYI